MSGAGNYYYMTHWNDMVNSTAVLTVENAAIANQGIYSASYMGDTPLHGAWMRLIVRGWLEADFAHKRSKHKKRFVTVSLFQLQMSQPAPRHVLFFFFFL